jgi:hypothetical protein
MEQTDKQKGQTGRQIHTWIDRQTKGTDGQTKGTDGQTKGTDRQTDTHIDR